LNNKTVSYLKPTSAVVGKKDSLSENYPSLISHCDNLPKSYLSQR